MDKYYELQNTFSVLESFPHYLVHSGLSLYCKTLLVTAYLKLISNMKHPVMFHVSPTFTHNYRSVLAVIHMAK